MMHSLRVEAARQTRIRDGMVLSGLNRAAARVDKDQTRPLVFNGLLGHVREI